MHIDSYTIEKIAVEYDPPISDSQTDDHAGCVVCLELHSDTGLVGIGFRSAAYDTSLEELQGKYSKLIEPLLGVSPFSVLARIRRPRGGNHNKGRFGTPDSAVDIALWDLCAKHLDVPLHELLGGIRTRVPTYVSGLHFSLDDEETYRHYEEYANMGFNAAKVKVGYPKVEADIDRLELVRDAMGPETEIMIDANEAWSPKETVRRVMAYRSAGIDIRWVEDPIIRDNIEGYQFVREQLPSTDINTGEYSNIELKREVLRRQATDILHLSSRDYLTPARYLIRMACEFDIQIAFHDTIGHACAHLGAITPTETYHEFWPRPWQNIVRDRFEVEDGYLELPDCPGHGIEFRSK